jgi:hypothetical protein
LQFLLVDNGWLLTGIKVFSCGSVPLSQARGRQIVVLSRTAGIVGKTAGAILSFLPVLATTGNADPGLADAKPDPIHVSNFLKLWLVLFGIWYGCVLGGFLIAMSGFFVGAAMILFFGGYYRYEQR